jgi:hypothetical protein
MSETIDLLQLHLARSGKERSKVVESKYYGWSGDPARHVKFESERMAEINGERVDDEKRF